MNEYTIVFRKRFSGTQHSWRIKRTADNVVVANPNLWFPTFNEALQNLIEFLGFMNNAQQ